MPRISGFSKSNKAQRSRKSTNAAGYAKRKAAKSKAGSTSDVYDYEPEKVRRSKVQLQYEKDELLGAPEEESESEGEGQARTSRIAERKPRLVGEKDGDEGLDEDEDEDIDSDAAFDESDEERFAGFSFSQKPDAKAKSGIKSKLKNSAAKGVRFVEVDLTEDLATETPELDSGSGSDGEEDSGEEVSDEEEEEEGDPDEFIDVLDVLDGRGEPDSDDGIGEVKSEPTAANENGAVGNVSDEESVPMDEDGEFEGESEEEEKETIAIDADEDVDVDDAALHTLEGFIAGLDAGAKRKAPDDFDTTNADVDEPRKRKRRMLAEQTEVGTESEFSTQAGATKLNLDDLLAPLASSSANLQSLKKSAKVLASTSAKVKTLAAPLPQRTQERLDRAAAYEQTKEEIDKWSSTIKRIKEAEHLSFPLQAEPTGKTSNLELMAKFKPTTEMESAVDKLLKTARMREQDIAQTETLKMNHLSVEEVAARRAELAKMRELIFRNEAKAKRIAKIKSKTYRRIKKKQKEKLAAKLGELEETDEEDEEGRMQMEMDRARERATLRHKNTGKWAKSMKGRNELDEDERKAIGEMLDRGEKLKRRIQGLGSDESEEEEDDDDDDDDNDSEVDGEAAVERIKADAFNELNKIQEEDDDLLETQGKKGKSVFEMKFMKDAMMRDKHKADKMAEDFIKELDGTLPSIGNEEDARAEEHLDTAAQRVGGRVSFRPGNATTLKIASSLSSDTSSVTLKSTDMLPNEAPHSPEVTSPVEDAPVAGPSKLESSNPWLAARDDVQLAKSKHEVAVGKNSANAEKSKNKLRKRVKKREEEKAKAHEDAAVDISMSNVMTLGSSPPAIDAIAKGKHRQAAREAQEDDGSEADSELDEQERLAMSKGKGRKAKGVRAFEQRDLVALAFAGDNVVRDFEEAKRREIQEDAPKQVDTTLPGWGSWGGLGTKKAPPKPYLIKRIAGVDPKSRADYNKANVIISEKRDKKAAKYLVKDLPYPYTSRAQFERSMDSPIGAEWNTRVGFQRGTLPKVVKKMGAVITPLEKL